MYLVMQATTKKRSFGLCVVVKAAWPFITFKVYRAVGAKDA